MSLLSKGLNAQMKREGFPDALLLSQLKVDGLFFLNEEDVDDDGSTSSCDVETRR